MSQTIIFIHGAWVTPLCWERFIPFFEEQGYTCRAPTWPHKDKPIEELRRNPPPALAGLGVGEIVDHYERIIRAQDESPILIGHSFGGLFVQMLLDRGLGAAGVAIDPAPPRGVLVWQWSALRANANVLFSWGAWKGILRPSFKAFRYAFVHTLPEAEQRAVYERHVVPETGRIFFQAGLAMLDRHRATRVNFKNNSRAPLLITAGGADHVVPAAQNRSTYAKYRASAAGTDFKEFAGQTHWLIAQEGWDDVAGYIAAWLKQVAGKKGAVTTT